MQRQSDESLKPLRFPDKTYNFEADMVWLVVHFDMLFLFLCMTKTDQDWNANTSKHFYVGESSDDEVYFFNQRYMMTYQ